MRELLRLLAVVLSTTILTTTFPSSAFACGSERWDVKTLQDADVHSIHWMAEGASVDYLRSIPAPVRPTSRTDEERQVYVVDAEILGFKMEADGDIHVVIAMPENRKVTMVAEVPDADCANAEYREQFLQAREAIAGIHRPHAGMLWLAKPVAAQFTGVLFFDKLHGQTGASPNGAELHPLLHVSVK